MLSNILVAPRIGCQELGYLQAYGKAICTSRDFNGVEIPVQHTSEAFLLWLQNWAVYFPTESEWNNLRL